MTRDHPRTAPELRAAVLDCIERLHALETEALGATGRRYRELSDEMNALECLAIDYTRMANRLEEPEYPETECERCGILHYARPGYERFCSPCLWYYAAVA